MSEDNIIKSFSKILTFVKELNNAFGNKYKNVNLYYKLLKKTPISNKVAMEKQNAIFKNFASSNKEFIISKNIKDLKQENIAFSEKVYINIYDIVCEADPDTSDIIFKHLQLVSYLLCNDDSIKQALIAPSQDNESKFINNFMSKIETTFKEENFTDPLSATMNLLQSGIFTDIVKTMNTDISSGKLNINKLLGSVQGMMTDISKQVGATGMPLPGGTGNLGGNPEMDINNIMNMATNLMSSSGQSMDMSSLLSTAMMNVDPSILLGTDSKKMLEDKKD
jgi:hypothetical protein